MVHLPSVIHTAVPDRGKLVTLIDGKRRRLLFAKTDDEVFRPERYAADNRTEFNCTQR